MKIHQAALATLSFTSCTGEHHGTRPKSAKDSDSNADTSPNVVVILIDDLGWNQVGYHAAEAGNYEIQTPNIDRYAREGIEMDRGYATPWCGPSRAAFQTGRMNSFNANITANIFAFDDSIGYIGGLPAGTKTIATAFKESARAKGKDAKAYYNGKWGIGGTAWANTPMGMGYDSFRGFWGDSIESCDGHVPMFSVPPYAPGLSSDKFGPLLTNVMPGYWDQDPRFPDSDMCPYLRDLPTDLLSDGEKFLACKTQPRKPPKIIDLDLLETVTDQIRNHDYEAGPMLQFFATQMMHMPMQYPKEYDEINNSTGMVPSYFRDGEIKPAAGNDDIRIATANGVRFVDDLVGATMQAIKDAGQWDKTVVYFSSDNGGAIYIGSANNNYPLRSSKFSRFEGGIRVTQFISGGWIDKNLPKTRGHKSDTYFFPNDLAPTLLEMAGAETDYILNGKKGAVYGKRMWEYIKNSVASPLPTETKTSVDKSSVPPHQKVRKVSYTADFYFDVKGENSIVKNFFTGNNPQVTPRLWSPLYPEKHDLLMDFSYVSIMPCRPHGHALPCCSIDVERDFQEKHPNMVDCDALHREAQELFEIEGGCRPDNERQTNTMCIQPGKKNGFTSGHIPEAYKLWSQYGAAGPFTNATGTPIGATTSSSLPMKCFCHSMANDTKLSEVDHYTAMIFSPTECYSSKKHGSVIRQSAACEGGSATNEALLPPSSGDTIQSYAAQGFDPHLFQQLIVAEQDQTLAWKVWPKVNLLSQNVHKYITRQGFTEWPNAARFPFNALGLDSCPAMNVTPVPWPVTNLAPYSYGIQDPTVPFEFPPYGLCSVFAGNKFFCPAKQNANLTAVESWHFGTNRPIGLFRDGRTWTHMTLIQCMFHCRPTPAGCAYIGDSPLGIVVDGQLETDKEMTA